MENIGIIGVFDLRNFDVGISKYNTSIDVANRATDRVNESLARTNIASNVAARAVSVIANVFNFWGTVLSRIINFLGQLAKVALVTAGAITAIAFATGKLDKLLLFISQITTKIPVLSNLFKQLATDYQAVGGSAGSADALTKRVLAIAGAGLAVSKVLGVFKSLKDLLLGTGSASTTTSGQINSLGIAAIGTSSSMSGLSNVLTIGVGAALGQLAGGLVTNVIQGFTGMAASAKNFVVEATMAASRANVVSSILGILGAKQGITTDEIDKSVAAIRKMGIEMGIAQDAVQQSIRYNISLADTIDLANVARNAAVIGNINTSDAMQRLNWGIQTQQTEILRGIGINIQADQAMKDYEKTINKSSEAFSAQERIQAMVNAVKREGIRIDGAYVAAQKEAGKELKSFDRYIDDIRIAMGTPLQGAFSNIIFSVSALLKTARNLVTEAGPVRTLLYDIGALAALATQPILDMAKGIENWLLPATQDMASNTQFALKNMTRTSEGEGQSFLSSLLATWGQAAEDALTWGAEIVAQLAEGMVEGAAWALNSAMTFIGNLLSSWLAPGSPPKVAPGLLVWGQEAMANWLQGFTEADFGILDSIQGNLKSVLDAMGRSADFVPMMGDLTEAIANFNTTGAVDAELMSKLNSIGGVYGSRLVDLTTKEFALAAATKKAEEANKRLYDAQNREAEATAKVSALTAEFNYLKASGASPSVLKAKNAEILASQKSALAAASATAQATKDAQTADEKASTLKSQISLQDKVLKQLLEMSQAQARLAEAAEKAKAEEKAKKAGAGKGTGLEIPSIGVGAIDFKKPLDKALEDAKEKIKEKLGKIFEPLKTKWETSIGPTLNTIKLKFDWFAGIVKDTFDKLGKAAQPTIDWLKSIIPPDLVKNIGQVVAVIGLVIAGFTIMSGVLTVVGGAIALVIGVLTSPIVLLVAAVVAAKLAWDNNWGGIRDTLTNIWNGTLKPTFEALWKWFTVDIPNAINIVMTPFRLLWGLFSSVWGFINGSLIPVFRAMADVVGAVLYKALEALHGFTDKFVIPILTVLWDLFEIKMKPAVDGVTAAVTVVHNNALVPLSNFIDKTLNVVMGFLYRDILVPVEGVFNRIPDAIKKVTDWLSTLATNIMNLKLPSWLTPGSPTPFENGLDGVSVATDTTTVSMTNFNTALQTISLSLDGVNFRMGLEAGLLLNVTTLQSLASGAMDTIGLKFQGAFGIMATAAYAALVVTGGIASNLQEIKSMNGMVSVVTVITHQYTVIHEPTNASAGSASGERQYGGPVGEGWWYLHNAEYVLSQAMREGRESLPGDVFSSRAWNRMLSEPRTVNNITNTHQQNLNMTTTPAVAANAVSSFNMMRIMGV